MSKITVLGAGMVGSAIARDLAPQHDVRSVDRDGSALAGLTGIRTVQADLSSGTQVREAIQDADLVVCAVPGFMGYRTLEAILEAGKNVVDISFMPEAALELDGLAQARGVTGVMDMGVAPGMDNLILGHHDATMTVQRFECLVGGLPQRRSYPFEYKAPFSPIDVIEEYTRPARYVANGQVVVQPALSEPELVDFDSVGTLESFNSDGLRSILDTMSHIPDMKEKTLRYPGHRALMAALAAGGFFGTEPIQVRTPGGQSTSIRPIDASSAILLEAWKLAPDEPEFTVMRVTVDGEERGEPVRYVYDLHDVYDAATRTSSMARTTGYACTSMVQLVLDGTFARRGLFAPEVVARNEGILDAVLQYQEARGIRYVRTRTERPS